jgi:hypothetical protein
MECCDCDIECEMLEPTKESPERRFKCPKCKLVYVAVDIVTDEDLELN